MRAAEECRPLTGGLMSGARLRLKADQIAPAVANQSGGCRLARLLAGWLAGWLLGAELMAQRTPPIAMATTTPTMTTTTIATTKNARRTLQAGAISLAGRSSAAANV